MSEIRNPSSLKSARKTNTPIRAQTIVTGCGILVYFVSNSGSSICDFRDAFVIEFAVDLLLNVPRETECANRFMLRSNDFIALAYFFEYPTILFFLDISSSSLPFIGTPSGTPMLSKPVRIPYSPTLNVHIVHLLAAADDAFIVGIFRP